MEGYRLPEEACEGVRDGWIKGITFVVSLLVVISIAVEGILPFWRTLASISPEYGNLKDQKVAVLPVEQPLPQVCGPLPRLPPVWEKIEEIMRHGVDVYISQVVKEKEEEKKKESGD